MDLPLISIIVPIYKVEKYMDRCIESLIEQTYHNLEIILIDDGSPDNCPAKCDEWGRKVKQIKVIHKQNGGLSDARNVGIEIAKGEYIVFVDSDDWVSPDYIKCLYETASSTNSDICECDIIKTNKENLVYATDNKNVFICYDTEDALELLIQDVVFHQYVWNKIYKMDCLKGIPFVKGKVNEDEFWTYRVFGKANKVVKTQRKLYFYFQHSESIMGRKYNVKRLDALEAKIERQQYIENNFPKLSSISRMNLIQSCIYSGQMIILFIDGKERDEALKKVRSFFKTAILNENGNLFIPGKNRIWTILAAIDFSYACKLRNILKIGL